MATGNEEVVYLEFVEDTSGMILKVLHWHLGASLAACMIGFLAFFVLCKWGLCRGLSRNFYMIKGEFFTTDGNFVWSCTEMEGQVYLASSFILYKPKCYTIYTEALFVN